MIKSIDYNSLLLFGSTVLSFQLSFDLIIKFILAVSTLLYNVIRILDHYKQKRDKDL